LTGSGGGTELGVRVAGGVGAAATSLTIDEPRQWVGTEEMGCQSQMRRRLHKEDEREAVARFKHGK
jgi:hypothetical protein